MKIFLVSGARPNLMKVAPIMRAIQQHNTAFKIVNQGGKKGSCPLLWDGQTAERIVEVLAR